jgi:hypothetical protein
MELKKKRFYMSPNSSYTLPPPSIKWEKSFELMICVLIILPR